MPLSHDAVVSSTGVLRHSTKIPPATRHLLEQVSWFNKLRFLAVGGMVVFTGLAELLGLLTEGQPLYGLAGVTLGLNLVYIWVYGTLNVVSPSRLRFHVNLQIGLDLLVLTAVLHYSGGCTNPFAFFFLFHTFIAAQVISVRAGLTVAGASLVLVCLLGLLEVWGIWPQVEHGIRLLDLSEGEVAVPRLLSWLLALGLTMGISVYFVATVLRQLRGRDEELRRLNQQLGQSEKLASIGTLAAGVAHEINNPVGVIRNKTQILRYRIQDGESAEALLAELDTVEKHTTRIGTITKGLLTFSKETPFELQPVDLNRLVREAAELVRVPYQEAEVELSVRASPFPVWVLGSDNHLLQVLVNILLNARDASVVRGKVWMVVEGVDGTAQVRIEDQGEGIAAENLSKIFDPFFTTKEVDRGTGLGLAITHGIVERHHGTVTVESEVGRGTTFVVSLPLHE